MIQLAIVVDGPDPAKVLEAAFTALEYLENRKQPPTGRLVDEGPTTTTTITVGDPPPPPPTIDDWCALVAQAVTEVLPSGIADISAEELPIQVADAFRYLAPEP